MNIAHFLLGRCSPENAGGLPITAYNLAVEQARLEHTVGIFSISPKPPIPIAGIQTRTYPPAVRCPVPLPARWRDLWVNRWPFGVSAQLLRDLRAWQPAIVHFHGVYIPQNVLVGRHLRQHQIPYCVTPNGLLSVRAQQNSWLLKKLYGALCERRYLAGAKFIHVVSHWDQEGLAVYGVRNRVIQAPNGIDLGSVPATVNRSWLRERFPQLRGRTVFLFVGRLDIYQKGLDLLLAAFASVVRQQTAALVLVGPTWRGSLERLTAQIQQLGLTERVLLAGPAFGQEKWDLLHGADVFVHPSRWEAGIPFSVLEALAAARPALLSPASDPQRLAETAGFGRTVELALPSLVEALQFLASRTPAELDQMGRQARQLVASEFSWARIARVILEGYSQP